MHNRERYMFEKKYWLSVLNTAKCDQNLQFLPLNSPVHFFSAYCACVNVIDCFNSQNQRQLIFSRVFVDSSKQAL